MTAVIDAQVHAYERDHAGRPWATKISGGADEATGDDHVAAMDGAGVDGALLVSPWVLYRYDTSYAEQVCNAYPGRFAMVAPVDPGVPGVGEAITEWAAKPGAVGIRLMVGFDTNFRVIDGFRADDPGVRAALAAAARHNLPVCVFCWDALHIVSDLASRYPDVQLVIDHLGVRQPFAPPPPRNPFAELDGVLALARFPNVAIKVSGACTLSHEPFPFSDLWAPLSRVYDAFGLERCMWGTDWTRAVQLVGYPEAVAAFREAPGLSASERDALLGGSLARMFSWSPSR
jgi:predicted TIM-barrel fold metal-dependent hydrolase